MILFVLGQSKMPITFKEEEEKKKTLGSPQLIDMSHNIVPF
jgi:hypothetical protein